jgi:queuine/archaeosine tRNA-ribosyltransferase
MDSCISYYNDDEPSLRYSPGALFLDNGAFSASMSGVELDADRIISVQEALMPSLTIPLDYPFGRHTFSLPQMQRRWNQTTRNILYWQDSTKLAGRLVPTLHAWSRRSLRDNIDWLSKNADAETIALGSLVDGSRFTTDSRGYFGDRQPKERTIEMISHAIKMVQESTDFGVHLMGFGSSPMMLHLAYFLGANSTDSSGHRRKAAFGKIVLQSTGERYLGGEAGVFGKGMELTNKRESDVVELERCDCNTCLTNKDLLWQDWKARAFHNEHVMKVESENARLLLSMGRDTYRRYLDVMFSQSSLERLWRFAKLIDFQS